MFAKIKIILQYDCSCSCWICYFARVTMHDINEIMTGCVFQFLTQICNVKSIIIITLYDSILVIVNLCHVSKQWKYLIQITRLKRSTEQLWKYLGCSWLHWDTVLDIAIKLLHAPRLLYFACKGLIWNKWRCNCIQTVFTTKILNVKYQSCYNWANTLRNVLIAW